MTCPLLIITPCGPARYIAGSLLAHGEALYELQGHTLPLTVVLWLAGTDEQKGGLR